MESASLIKTVIFDLGNVLLQFNHDQMILQLSHQLDIPFSHLKKLIFDEGWIASYEAGLLTTDEILSQLKKSASIAPTQESLLSAMNTIFKENVSLTPLVNQLKKQKKKVFLLSNTNEAHFSFIKDNFPFISLFDEMILSYEVKCSKPEKKIYEKTLEIAHCRPHECFYLDDVLGHVQAARSLGIDAEVYTSTEQFRKDLALRFVFL